MHEKAGSELSTPVKVLVSPTCLEEARLLVELGVDIIDVKNPVEGSLGAQPPWVIREIAAYANSHAVPVSATLGDLPYKPGTAALAAFGLAQLGVQYVKAGLHGATMHGQAVDMLHSVQRAVRMADETIALVAAGYADYRQFGGLTPRDLVRAASETRCAVVMLDTADKQGGSLFNVMDANELESFVASARAAGLTVALAGSIGREHVARLRRLGPDIIGVRGALCARRDRTTRIDPRAAREFIDAVREPAGTAS